MSEQPIPGRLFWIPVAVAAAVVFGLGIAGFAALKQPGDDVLDLAYRSLQLFSAQSGDHPDGTPAALDFARFVAPAVSLAFAAVVLRQLVELFRYQRVFGLPSADHVVVCGLGRSGAALGRGLTERGFEVVAISLDEDNAGVAKARNHGVKVIKGDAREVAVINRARIPRARTVVVLCGDDQTNAEVASRIAKHTSSRILIGIKNRRLASEFSAAMKSDRQFEPLNLPADAAARMVDLVEGTAPALGSVLIVGFGALGQAVAAELAQRNPERRTEITAVDRDAERKKQAVQVEVPALEGCDLEAHPLEFVSKAFEQLSFLDSRQEITAAFVCVSNDALAVTLGLQLRRHRRLVDVPIVVRVNEVDRGLAQLLGDRAETQGVEFFGVHDAARALASRV